MSKIEALMISPTGALVACLLFGAAIVLIVALVYNEWCNIKHWRHNQHDNDK